MKSCDLYSEECRVIITKTYLQQIARGLKIGPLTDSQIDAVEGVILDRLNLFAVSCISESLMTAARRKPRNEKKEV